MVPEENVIRVRKNFIRSVFMVLVSENRHLKKHTHTDKIARDQADTVHYIVINFRLHIVIVVVSMRGLENNTGDRYFKGSRIGNYNRVLQTRKNTIEFTLEITIIIIMYTKERRVIIIVKRIDFFPD